MKKRVLAALLAASMVVGCTACMSKGSESSGGKKKDKSAEAVAVPDDIWDAYEEEVNLSTVIMEDTSIQWKEGDSYDKNPWYDAFKERFNINLKNDWISSDYNTKLNLSIADGDLPDVFVVNAKQLHELQEADLIWDLTDLYEKYASDETKACLNKDKDTFDTAVIDKKLWGIPKLHYGFIDQPSMVWVRKDWKDALNIEDPKTIDDFVAMSKKFKENYGSYAIAEDQNLSSMKAIAPAWGAYPTIWVEQEDGTIGYGSVQPEMKEVLKNYAEWYKEGLVYPEFAIADQAKKEQGIITGEVGIEPTYQWWAYVSGPDIIRNQGKDATFEAHQIPTATGEETKAAIRFANLGYTVVSKDCKNPEAVFKILNFFTFINGKDARKTESKEYVESLTTNGYGDILNIFVMDPDIDYNRFVATSAALEQYRNGEEVDLEPLGAGAQKYIDSVNWIENAAPESVSNWYQMGSEKSAYGLSKYLLDNDLIIKDKVWGLSTETWQNTSGALNTILIEGFTKIIMGEEPVEYFDTIVEDWMNAGGEQATKEVNETYGK